MTMFLHCQCIRLKHILIFQAQVELLTERLSQLTENISVSTQGGEGRELQARFQAIVLTSGALSLYIKRVDLFMSNFMS